MKKGFTLIELITTIVILGTIVLIAVPFFDRYVLKSNQIYYHNLEKTLQIAAEEYLNDYRLLPKYTGEAVLVTEKEILENKYLEQIIDTKEERCTVKISSLKLNKTDYKYEVCLKCGENYNSDKNICEKIDGYTTNRLKSVVITGKDINNKSIESGVWTYDDVDLKGITDPEFVTGGYKYQWYKNSELIDSAQDDSYKATESGTYQLEVTDRFNHRLKSNSFEVKIDRIKPNPPEFVADDDIKSNEWHTKNYVLNLKGANNSSGNTYYYGTTITPASLGDSISITENGTVTYYAIVCSGAGLCSDNSSYISKLDTTKPTIKAKNASQYIAYPTNADPLDYFTVTYGESGGSTTCTVSNLNELNRGSNTVTCTAKGNNGLTASASTIFKHEYSATKYCANGGTLQNNTCYYSSNETICGSDCVQGCDYKENPCKTTGLQCKEGYVNGNCIQYKCTRYKSCYSTLCAGGFNGSTVCFSSYPSSGGGLNYTNCNMQMDANYKITWCCQEQRLGMCRNVLCGTETYTSNYTICDTDGLVSSECSQYNQIYSTCATYEETCIPGLDEYNCSDCKYKTPKSCTKDTSEYLKYSCPNGGTLSGTICRF